MNVKLEDSFESVITPPMTERLRDKLMLARQQRRVREENFERISSYTRAVSKQMRPIYILYPHERI